MERLPLRINATASTNARGPGKFQRWVRTAVLGTLPFLCGNNPPPAHHQHGDIAQSHALHMSHTRTEEEHLSILAQSLNTPEKLGQYLQASIRYVREPNGKDHWQAAQETIRRGNGDCEDFAFLAQAILTLQGKTAHVVSPPGHAVCVAVERRPDGKYDGYGFDEYGCNRNGDAYFAPQRGIGKAEPVTPDGYATVLEAINAVLQQYESGDPSASHYKVQPYWIPVLRLRWGTLPHEDIVTVHAFDPDAPIPMRISGIDIAALTALLGGAYETYRLLRRRREGAKETWKEYFTTFRLH